ncbi:TMV resistance protein N-like [Mercurialis annua]|uniref:TMV resistance protein N-like n=1 Tax=Mercurialis annua TaxID=3986 RepID=UPI0024ADB5F8|nr:TMV resistance protein N-like [Mercurialis annua]
MASSSSASRSAKQWKYEVFLTFRSKGASDYFTSHLYSSLRCKWINTYGDDKLYGGGEEITLEHLEVIKESKIVVIVFSKDFASSTLRLDEVVKIIECSETYGQIVVPVFVNSFLNFGLSELWLVDDIVEDIIKKLSQCKTTLAKAVFKRIACRFESWEKGVGTSLSNILRSPAVKRKINKKVLIVVDDVNRTQQFKFFENNRCFFGKGSRIVVTTRDKQMILSNVDDIYEVNELYFFEARTLLRQNVFKKTSPIEDYRHLLSRFLKFAKNNPLALKVLGSFLSDKNQREWKRVLDDLERLHIRGVQDVLKISFDSFDDDKKDIFLYIACFFRGHSRKEVTRILNCCGLNVDIGLCVLMDKSLIAVSGKIEMYELLQEMGKQIFLQESREPCKRSRLWDHEEIVSVLTNNQGTDAIEAIFLDLSKIKAIDLNPDVFKEIPHLKLLSFFYGSETETCDKVHFLKACKASPTSCDICTSTDTRWKLLWLQHLFLVYDT